MCGNDLQTLLDFCGSPQIDTVERVKGIEPSYAAWEAAVLPLNYTRAVRSVPWSRRPGHGGDDSRMNGLIATAGRCLAWAAMALCTACASLPPPPAKPVEQAWAQPEATELGSLAAAAAPNLRFSGFRLLASGEDALAALAALADHAQHTLDLQYYLMRDDASTRALLRHVHGAAQRGVRVRVLLDDLNTAGADDALICLTRHPNIELRLYNPFPAGRGSTLTRVLASIRDLRRVNQRMHNKLFVADNAIAVTGGRNLGDAYFVQSLASNFVDLDVIAAGPVVRDLSASFDRFWNSDLAWPLQTLDAKALVIDRRLLLIGSMNMDPRSARLNTEVALAIRSPLLAAEVVRLFDDVAGSSSYRLEALADGQLRWIGPPGTPTFEGTEPDAGLGTRLLLLLLGPFAPDELL